MIPIFSAKVEKNRLVFDEPENFSMWLQQFVDKKVEVIVRKKKRKRTTGQPDELGNQNGWYWSVILPLSANTLGYTINEMHEVFTEEFAPYTFKDFGNKKVKVKIRSSEMDTVQFKEYCEFIIIKMAEFGCIIPDPEKMI